jgi:hypothetical protein
LSTRSEVLAQRLEEGVRQLKRGATRAIVIAFKDAGVVQGCEVTARWECTVPGQR